MKFVLFHGAFGSPEGNWFPQLKEKLEAMGQEVIVPQFPVDSWDEVTKLGPGVPLKNQSLEKWFKAFEPIYKSFKKGEKLCFVGHSLGPLFILHAVEKFNLKLDSAIFVSPFLSKLNKFWQIDLVNRSFYKSNFDFKKLKKLIPVSYVLYSDNDPYVDKKHSLEFAEQLNSSVIFIKKAGHMNSEVNLNEFPLIFDLCASRIDMSLYQRYLEHRKNLYALDYVQSKPQGVIHLKPEEIIDEGVFHFRHLQKEGFCTFLTRLADWDPESKYFEDGRKAARRIGNFTRVFIVEKVSDLGKPKLQRQIELDIGAGISVYLCPIDRVKNMIGELDFGIWDTDYVCTIHEDEKGVMQDIILDSTRKIMAEAKKWKKIILANSVSVKDLEKDIQEFIRKNL